jgi:hypothetical protein
MLTSVEKKHVNFLSFSDHNITEVCLFFPNALILANSVTFFVNHGHSLIMNYVSSSSRKATHK